MFSVLNMITFQKEARLAKVDRRQDTCLGYCETPRNNLKSVETSRENKQALLFSMSKPARGREWNP